MMAGDPDDELNSVQLELNSGYHELDVDGGGEILHWDNIWQQQGGEKI